MVDLPSVSNVVPQVRAPESRVSPGQIAAPYQELAANLSKMGEVTQEYGGKLAAQEGERAVSANGKTIAEPVVPILGAASAEFARAARFTALGRMTPDIENRMAEIRLEHANDPKGFQAAADQFRKTYINGDEDKGLPPITDPALKGPVEKTILHQAGSGYRSVLEQTNQTNITNGKTTITSQISDLSNRMAQSAFTGGADSEDYKRMQGDLGALYQELGNDPRMGYPKARIESEVSEMTSQHKTMAIAGQAVRMMDSDDPNGRANAKKWLIDKVYNDQSLNLSLAQRHQAVTTAMGLMEARSSESKALIAANSQTVTTLLTQLHGNTPYNPITVNDAIANSAKIGDVEGYYKLTFAKGMHEWDSTIRSLPLPQQMAALKNLDTMRSTTSAASGEAMSFFTGKGYTKEQAAGIVGNLIQESGLNPNTVHDNGTGLGVAGHRLERLDAMKQYAASKGKPVNDFQTQLEFIDQELNTTEGATGKALRAAKTPQEAATAFINFERPQGWTPENPQGGHGYSNRVANAVAVAGGPTGRAGEAWFNEARIEQVGRTREYLKGQAPDIVDTTISRLNKTGDVPDADLKNVSEMLRETGRDDLREKLNVSLMAHYGVKELDSLPTSVRQAWVMQSRPDSNLEFKVKEHMAAGITANIEAMKVTPYSTFANRTNGQAPPAYNFEDPQNVSAVATVRAGLQKTIRNNDGTGPMSVFEGKEAEAFGNSLTNGDPAKAAQSLAGLAALPDDIYQATLAQKPIATAVAGMMSSKEPNRMTAAMSAADKLWRANPADAKDALGDSAITKLQAWQGLKGSFNSEEIALRLNDASDPGKVTARKEAKEEAEKEVEKIKPEEIAYKLGSSLGIPIISRVANLVTGATPAVPYDSITARELAIDYRSTYTALRAYGVDSDKASDLAVTRLKDTWGISAAAGNQLMRNPPENRYPSIDGSRDWIKGDLNDWVSRQLGPAVIPHDGRPGAVRSGTFEKPSARYNWRVEGMISDGQTQAEISAGRPPSYQVAIKKADGTSQLMGSRVVFDPSNHIEEHDAKLEQRRQTVDFMRTNPLNSGMPLP